MGKQNVDEILQHGIHGPKEIKPEERRRFLGTLRERVVVALTRGEVMGKRVQPELVRIFKTNSEAHLYLNGNISYPALSKYIKEAEAQGISYTIVTNKEHNSEFGLVLAYDHAIDKEEITLVKKKKPAVQTEAAAADKSLFSKVKTLFGKK
jgi:uncharacterized protein YueI